MRMNINFAADRLDGGTVDFSDIYLISTFHLLSKILPQGA